MVSYVYNDGMVLFALQYLGEAGIVAGKRGRVVEVVHDDQKK